MTVTQALLNIADRTIYSYDELFQAAYYESTGDEMLLKVWLIQELQAEMKKG